MFTEEFEFLGLVDFGGVAFWAEIARVHFSAVSDSFR